MGLRKICSSLEWTECAAGMQSARLQMDIRTIGKMLREQDHFEQYSSMQRQAMPRSALGLEKWHLKDKINVGSQNDLRLAAESVSGWQKGQAMACGGTTRHQHGARQASEESPGGTHLARVAGEQICQMRTRTPCRRTSCCTCAFSDSSATLSSSVAVFVASCASPTRHEQCFC